MKRNITICTAVAAASLLTASCSGFLKEDPKTFEQPSNYYRTEQQVRMGVNGIYYGLRIPFNTTGIGGCEVLVLSEMFCGYAERTASSFSDLTEILSLSISAENGICAGFWGTAYANINRANQMIDILVNKDDIQISDAMRNQYLGEAYFLRAWFYSILVRMYGPVPLLTKPTTGFNDAKVSPSPEKEVFDRIIEDLQTAETLMEDTPWNNAEGRVSKGAVKAHLAKMYLTCAGYPLQDASAFDKAYEKALEVVRSGEFDLYPTYDEARLGYDTNGREYLFSIQCMRDQYQNPLHMLSIPRVNGQTLKPYISLYDATRAGGAWAPRPELLSSYASGDRRTDDHAFYYTSQTSLDGTVTHTFPASVYKYWDDECAVDGKSGMNFPLIRYADVLLTLAEAACKGASTNDAEAIDAYFKVHSRALPSDSRPTSLTFDQVFKERIWEQAFDGENWFNMIRTRKAFDLTQGTVVDLIGYKAPAMSASFEEEDLLIPYPVEQVRLNPNLKK